MAARPGAHLPRSLPLLLSAGQHSVACDVRTRSGAHRPWRSAIDDGGRGQTCAQGHLFGPLAEVLTCVGPPALFPLLQPQRRIRCRRQSRAGHCRLPGFGESSACWEGAPAANGLQASPQAAASRTHFPSIAYHPESSAAAAACGRCAPEISNKLGPWSCSLTAVHYPAC